MRLNNYFDDISLTPFKEEFKGYTLSKLHSDLTAAITVALLTIPQSMAVALVAGLPLSTALFASFISAFIAGIFGSSKHLVLGPSGAIAILIQYGIAHIMAHHYPNLVGAGREIIALQIMIQITFIVAILHLLASFFKLGQLTQFVSYSVVLGYIAGVSAAIIIDQMFIFCGIESMVGIHSLWNKVIYFFNNIVNIHATTLFIGGFSLILLLWLKKWHEKMPAALITYLVITTFLLVSRLFLGGEFLNVIIVGDTGEISTLSPTVQFPIFDLSIMNNLLPVSFAIAIFCVLETVSVAKSVATYSGQRLSINQETLALGLGNLVSGLIGAMPLSGSTSRSVVNFESGAQTRLAACFSALLVGLILYLFEDFVSSIPLAALSALLFITAGNLIKKKQLLICLKSTTLDAFVFVATFSACIFLSIDVAFYIGVVLSVILYLKKASKPQVLQYIVDDTGRIKNVDFCKQEELTKIRFIKIKGELFFGAADLFQATLKSITEDKKSAAVIILQLKNARDIDGTVCLAIQQLYDYLESSNRHLILSGITIPIWEIMSTSGLVKYIGKENIFVINDTNPNLYFEKALNRASVLLSMIEQEEREVVDESAVVGEQVILQDPT